MQCNRISENRSEVLTTTHREMQVAQKFNIIDNRVHVVETAEMAQKLNAVLAVIPPYPTLTARSDKLECMAFLGNSPPNTTLPCFRRPLRPTYS